MNERIKELERQATEYANQQNTFDPHSEFSKKFAELIVKECADAADMAYAARCPYPGDYVGEQLGYGEEHGIVAWRCGEA